MATAAETTICEVDELLPIGAIDPDDVHLPGVFVQRVVPHTPEQEARKAIEKLTTRGARPAEKQEA